MRKIFKVSLLILLLLISLFMIFYPHLKASLIKQQTAHFYLNNEENVVEEKSNVTPTYDTADVVSISDDQILKSMMEKSWTNVIGYIAIPDVNLQLPIFEGLNNANLIYGAGTVKANQIMGEKNYALASHKSYNPNLLFSPLLQVNLNSKIYLLDKKANMIYEYDITSKDVVSPDRIDVLNDNEKPEVTLITCNDDNGNMRLVVKANLIKKLEFSQASSDLISNFKQ